MKKEVTDIKREKKKRHKERLTVYVNGEEKNIIFGAEKASERERKKKHKRRK